MDSRKTYTIADVERVVGVKRHVIDYWCKSLPPLANKPTRERVARRFIRQDVLFLIAIGALTSEYGIKVEAIGAFALKLHALLGPSPDELRPYCIFLPPGRRDVLLTETHARAQAGTYLPLTPVVDKLLAFLDVLPPTPQSDTNVISLQQPREAGDIAAKPQTAVKSP